MRIAIIVAEFNPEITHPLRDGAISFFKENKISGVDVLHVPGAFEIPVKAAQLFSSRKKYDGIVTIGCLIKGETDHYDYIAQAVASGLQSVAIEYRKPVSFGVLTCHTYAQARRRAGRGSANKGREAAAALLAMLKK
ncbi:MAG: 6,7-dimethyl-8-ribityllumazine synthase [Patescibacteria group bacterium]